MAYRIILDTDLGSDVDDALALAVLLGHRDVDLVAVTTVYGDTLLRARLAQRYARLAGRHLVVHAGRAETRSGRPVWWAGHEGTLHPDLTDEPVDASDAVDALVRAAEDEDGELVIIAVGPLTNLAAALDADAGFAGRIRQLVIMGGWFTADQPEHNVLSDIAAAQRVFASDLPTVVSGLEITRRLRVSDEQVQMITAAGPLGAALARDIDQWCTSSGQGWSVPHDPVAVQSRLRSELFTLSPTGMIMIDPVTGVSRFRPDPAGTHRVVTDLDAEAVARAIVDDIVAAHRP